MKYRAHLAGVIFSTIFGFSFMFSKIALDSNFVSPMGLIAYRFLLAILVFEILKLTKLIKIKFNTKYIIPVLIVSLFQPVLYFIFEAYGLNLITSSEAGMMIALIPIFVALLSSLLLKEKPTILQIIFIFLSLAGIFIIQIVKLNTTDGSSSFLGFILLLGAVLSASMFNIASRNASTKNISPIEITYFMMLYGALVFNLIYIIQLSFNNSLPNYLNNLLHPEVIIPVAYLGILASVIAFFLVNYALSKLPAHVSSIYANFSTVVAVIAGHFFLGDELSLTTIIGGLMIIIGVYGVARVNYLNNFKNDLF